MDLAEQVAQRAEHGSGQAQVEGDVPGVHQADGNSFVPPRPR